MTIIFSWNVPGPEVVCFTGPFGAINTSPGQDGPTNSRPFVLDAPTAVDPCNPVPAYLWVDFTITTDADCDRNQTNNTTWSYGMTCQ